MITEIRFWEDKILFRDGWYLYLHESGDCSVISAAVAKKIVIKGKNKEMIWPAITGRQDKKTVLIVAYRRVRHISIT